MGIAGGPETSGVDPWSAQARSAWAGYDEVDAMDAADYRALMDDVAAALDEGAGDRLPAQELQEGLVAARRVWAGPP